MATTATIVKRALDKKIMAATHTYYKVLRRKIYTYYFSYFHTN